MIVLDTPEQIEAYAMLSAHGMLRIEIKTGLRHSRGSVMNVIKTRWLPNCTKRTKAAVLKEFQALLLEKGILTQEQLDKYEKA